MERKEGNEKEEDGEAQIRDLFLVFILYRRIERLIECIEDRLEYMSIACLEELPICSFRDLLEHIVIDIGTQLHSFLIIEVFSSSIGSDIGEECA